MLRLLERELARIEAQIDALVRPINRRMLVCHAGRVRAGPNTAWSILAYLSEITSRWRNELVALAGLVYTASAQIRKRRMGAARQSEKDAVYGGAIRSSAQSTH